MSQVFNLTRFLRLLHAHWVESWRTYAWFLAVCAILNGIFLAMAVRADAMHQYFALQASGQADWYGWGLVITGLVFATRYFESFSGAGSTLIQLMRPASAFEKWLLALLLVGVLFPLVYTAVYACMNAPAVAYAKAHYVVPTYKSADMTLPVFQIYLPFVQAPAELRPGRSAAVTHIGELLFAFQWMAALALCLSGRVFFKRAAVLKTCLLAFVLLLVVFCLSEFGVMEPFSAGVYWMIQEWPRSVFGLWEVLLVCAILFGVPILLWIGLFFHIREREVS